MPDDSDLFKRNMLDRYLDRPDSELMQGKFSAIDGMCYASFSPNYGVDRSAKNAQDKDWQPIILDESASGINHNDRELPKLVPLMNSEEKLKFRKVPNVLRYFTPNKHKFPERYAHHMLMLFYPFRLQEGGLKDYGSYVSMLLNDNVLEIVNRNKEIFDCDLAELVLQNYNNNIEHTQDPFSQQEMKS